MIALILASTGAVMSPEVATSGQASSQDSVRRHPATDADSDASGAAGRDAIVSRNGARSAERALAAQVAVAMRRRSAALDRLAGRATTRAHYLEANQWVLPLKSYEITATFGEGSYLWSSVHTGIDLAAPSGTPIASVGAGEVAFAGYDGPYGYKVIVQHPDGTATWYAHMASISVTPEQQTGSGTVLGTVGSSGNVTGPHLHFEVRPPGQGPVDPQLAMAQRGVRL